MSWDQCFDRPVILPDGKTLRTLEDATAGQVAIEALLIAAEKHDP